MTSPHSQPISEPVQRRGCLLLIVRRVIGFIFVLIGAGLLFETIMMAGDAQRYPAPGQIIDVDGYAMHLSCLGEGSTTIVFMGGAGALSYQDAALQKAISSHTRACIYDRAGYLWSTDRPEPRTVWQIADELHALLSQAEIKPPYILVGSSNGGIYARAFAAEYPESTAGLVMVDARLETSLGQGGSFPTWMFQAMGRVGLFRLFPGIICPEDACDPAYREPIAVFRGYTRNLATYDREIKEGLDGSPEQIALINARLGTAGVLGDTPLVILQANQSGKPIEEAESFYREYVEAYRTHYTSLSSNVDYVLIPGGHGLAVEHPEAVIKAIDDVLDASSTGRQILD